MSKRFRRIESKTINNDPTSLIGKMVHLVLKNNVVHLVSIEKVKSEIIVGRNAMRHQLKLHLQDIREIWIESQS